MSERSFPPRVLLGAYLADRLNHLVADAAAAGADVALRANTPVTDVAYGPTGVQISHGGDRPGTQIFDHVVLATGHVWPVSDEADRGRFASPWPTSQLVVPNGARVAVLGSSLSAIDAAVTLALQSGRFTPVEGGLRYDRRPGTPCTSPSSRAAACCPRRISSTSCPICRCASVPNTRSMR